MKVYSIYMPQAGEDNLIRAKYIKEHFYFGAFILGPLWALYHRLWSFTIVLTALLFSIIFFIDMHYISQSLGNMLQAILFLYAGCSMTDWYQDKLVRAGYVLKDIIVASDENEAQYRFITKHSQPMTPQAALEEKVLNITAAKEDHSLSS